MNDFVTILFNNGQYFGYFCDMKFLNNNRLKNGGLAFILLGLLFASVPFFQIFHHHVYSSDTSKVAYVKDYETKCCKPLKIQSHFNAILAPQEAKIKIIFIDNYTIHTYNYSYNTVVKLSNKAPPVTPIV